MEISGWGRYPRIESEVLPFETEKRLADHLVHFEDCIVHARGRSYGDSALSRRAISTSRFDKMLHFDAEQGVLACESGVTLAEILEVFVPRGWFLAAVPGTKYVSVGGAIASDVHGKNHHNAGCFSESVVSLDMMMPSGEVVTCSKTDHPQLFRATCGGMGLTGVILRASIGLRPLKSARICEKIIRCKNLEETVSLFDQHRDSTYSVAWTDCLAKGRDRGRSILMLGEHAGSGGFALPKGKNVSVPFDFPGFFPNKYAATVFNDFYYRTRLSLVDERTTPLESFFYPLDRIGRWNRIYGAGGFAQYHFVLPEEAGLKGLKRVLAKIADSGSGPFLAVLKLLGAQNGNFLSFPMTGYTLAMDFKMNKKLFALLDTLDRIVLDHGGRIYLAKDARMSKDTFRSSYPRWEEFFEIRRKYGLDRKFHSLQSKRLGI